MDATVKGVTFSDIGDFGNLPARLTRWTANGSATWQARLAAGTYKVTIRASKLVDQKLALKVGEKSYILDALKAPATAPGTSPRTAPSPEPFVLVPEGTVEVEKDGVVTIELRSLEAARDLAVADLMLEPG